MATLLTFTQAAFLLGALSGGASFEDVPIRKIAHESSDIAVVEVSSRVPVNFSWEGKTHVCGYQIKARVLQSFKGAEDSLEFFSTTNATFRGAEVPYLVFVYRGDPDRTREDARFKAHSRSLGDLERRKELCVIENTRSFVHDGPRTMIPFGGKLHTEEGSWLLVDGYSAVDSQYYRRKLLIVDGREEAFVSWGDVEAEIVASVSQERSSKP